jgi:hypothetical protein
MSYMPSLSHVPSAETREQRLIEAVVSLDERDRLARRLSELEQEIDALAVRLDQHQREFPETRPPVAQPPGPTRTRL